MSIEFGLTPEIEKMIGKEWKFIAPEELGKASIRMFALAIGDFNPLYIDDGYASGSKYGGVIAPPTFICETTQYMTDNLESDGGPARRPKLLPMPDIRGGNAYVFFKPTRPEDLLSVSWKIADIVQKDARTGRLLIVTTQISYSNQHGELLAVNKETTIYRDPKSTDSNVTPQPPDSVKSNLNVDTPAASRRTLETPLYFEEVDIGDELPPLVKNVTPASMAFYGASTWDFHRFHYDQEFVKSKGFPAPFLDGQELGAFLAQLVTDWTGDPSALRDLSFRFRDFVFPGDTLICKGKVVDKYQDSEANLVKCEMYIETSLGKIALSPGNATICLPSIN